MKKLILLITLVVFQLRLQAQMLTLPHNQDFETSDGGWYMGNDAPIIQVPNVWYWGEPKDAIVDTAASGKNAWYTTLKNNPEDFFGAPYIVSPNFNLIDSDLRKPPVGAVDVSFKFAMNLQGEGIGAFAGINRGFGWEVLGSVYENQEEWGYNTYWEEEYIHGWSNLSTPWKRFRTTYGVLDDNTSVQFGISFRHLGPVSKDAKIGLAMDDFKVDIIRKPSVNIADSLALVSLYNSTDGPHWFNNSNWLRTSVYYWEGVYVHDGRVVFLTLGDQNLTGKLPKELSKLEMLSSLDVSNNNLSGSIPSEYSTLNELFWFELKNNNLSGNLPYFPNIFYISANGNKFTSITPPLATIDRQIRVIMNNRLSFEDLEPYLAKITDHSSQTYSPQDSIGELKRWIVNAGSSFQLTAAYSGNSVNNRYQWYKEGKAITPLQTSPYLSLNNVPAGFSSYYHCAVTNSKVPGLTLWTKKNFVTVRNANEKVIYRVNAGAASFLNDVPLNWGADSKTNSSLYLKPISNTLTEGGCWTPDLINTTGAPNCIFGSFRVAWGEGLRYKFPVANGSYKVNLYFAAKRSSTTVLGKTFNVFLENQLKLKDFDIYATAGFSATVKTFIVSVIDGELNVNLTTSKGYAQINGIEISSLSTPAPLASAAIIEEPVVFPNPWASGNLTLDLKGYVTKASKIEMTDKQGQILYSNKPDLKGVPDHITFDASSLNLKPGLYFLKLFSQGGEPKIIRLIKE